MKEVVNVTARDGTCISATRFCDVDVQHDRVVIINSATAVLQTYYVDFAQWLTRQGSTVYTFDYRGIGDSKPEELKDVLSDMHDWSSDVDAMISYVTRNHPQAKLIIVGHSIGGQLLGMAQLTRHADALIFIGSQTPYWKNYQGLWMKIKLLSLWYFTIPLLTKIYGYFPAKKLGLFEDLPAQVALQWARWARTKNYIFDELPKDRTSFEALSQPSLMISFADDALAPYKAVLDLKRFFKKLQPEHWHLHPEEVLQQEVGHFGFFRKRSEHVLWRELQSWVSKQVPAMKKRAA